VNTIKKRDGRVVSFDISKIRDAIYKAMFVTNTVDINKADFLSKEVVAQLNDEISVEKIQDIVEQTLQKAGLNKTAKEFSTYRLERTRIREQKAKLMQIVGDLTFKSKYENESKRENANVDGDTAMGVMLKYGSETAKTYYESSVLNPKYSTLHKDGDIHIHDLDFFALTTTCCQIDLQRLFKGGFCTGHGFLREPQSILAYASLACIAIQSNQNDQHGGQSIPDFDYAMSSGVAKTFAKLYRENFIKAVKLLQGGSFEKYIQLDQAEIKLSPTLDDSSGYLSYQRTQLAQIFDIEFIKCCQDFAMQNAYRETDSATYQAMEAFIHNLNTMHSRAGAQVPFSSINYGTDTSAEGRMVVSNLLKATIAGLGNGETPIFPIQIFKVKEGVNFNQGEPNYDLFKLAMKCSAKRLFPNFSFIDAPFNLQYYKKGQPNTEIAYMGCRTRVIGNILDKDREIVTGRGNLSFTSINLVRLGIKSRIESKNNSIKVTKNLLDNLTTVDSFFENLDRQVDIVISQLLERFKIQSQKTVKNFPFLMGQGVWIDSENLTQESSIEQILKHGSMAVGFIGLAETLKVLTGYHHGESEHSQTLGLKIVKFIRDKVDAASQKYRLNFSVIATPAEGLSGRFVALDSKLYGKIEGVTDREYYTNSFHVPVYYKIKAHKKIELEAPYHALTNGGHISYVELDGDTIKNPQAFEQIIRYMKTCNIGYGSINHPIDRDPICGYTGVIKDICPQCNRMEGNVRFERIRRITGYLVGTVERFNDGKRSEERDRVKHS
jgi:ribonucleoside-triphosphate reductase